MSFFYPAVKKKKVEKSVMEIEVERFDKVFFETELRINKRSFLFFPPGNEDAVGENLEKV
jgi:hypothetical protein